MLWPSFRAAPLRALLLVLPLAVPLTAQTNHPSNKERASKERTSKELDGYVKSLLIEYYTGKFVRAKVVIPATERGLEIVDGRLDVAPSPASAGAAQPGDLLLISGLKFKAKSIEVEFGGDEPIDERSAVSKGDQHHLTKGVKRGPWPRLTLRFSHELAQRDLTVQNINRLLANAVDVSQLAPKVPPPPPAPATVAELPPKRPDASTLAERAAHAQGIPTATLISELVGESTAIGELTVECSAGRARVYIDDVYSGWTPRTVKLRAGIHSILVVAEGYAMWEQKFFIPGAKASLIRAELKRTTP